MGLVTAIGFVCLSHANAVPHTRPAQPHLGAGATNKTPGANTAR
jgi:hypothetical protein